VYINSHVHSTTHMLVLLEEVVVGDDEDDGEDG
jgi:hypothetical protein